MSGGHFNYYENTLCSDIFDSAVYPDYGFNDKNTNERRRIAARINPFDDRLISEIVYDVLCVIHSLDYYISGDICEDTYRKDADAFKKKWLGQSKNEISREIINQVIEDARNEIYHTFGFADNDHM